MLINTNSLYYHMTKRIKLYFCVCKILSLRLIWRFYQKYIIRNKGIPDWLWKRWYNGLASLFTLGFINFKCMNYGSSSQSFDFLEEYTDEKNQYTLYYQVATNYGQILLHKLKILEVSCGRGGGAAFIVNQFKPKSYTGIDSSNKLIKECKRTYCGKNYENLHFEVANALNLPFADDLFDMVINVESSHCYPSFQDFVSSVYRVLKPKGLFMFADFRLGTGCFEELESRIIECGFNIVQKEDITASIFSSLNADHGRKMTLINNQKIPMLKFFRAHLQAFVACKNTPAYNEFKEKKRVYMQYLIRK